jgi:hypothetical protein
MVHVRADEHLKLSSMMWGRVGEKEGFEGHFGGRMPGHVNTVHHMKGKEKSLTPPTIFCIWMQCLTRSFPKA